MTTVTLEQSQIKGLIACIVTINDRVIDAWHCEPKKVPFFIDKFNLEHTLGIRYSELLDFTVALFCKRCQKHPIAKHHDLCDYCIDQQYEWLWESREDDYTDSQEL